MSAYGVSMAAAAAAAAAVQQQKAGQQTASELRGVQMLGWNIWRQRTWRADAEKARRWAWAKAFLAANMMDVMGVSTKMG